MRIVFHGYDAFRDGFERHIDQPMEIHSLPDMLSAADAGLYADADVIIGTRFDQTLPVPARLRLFQVSGAGHEHVRLDLLPASAVVCNSHGHEGPIVEYVMAALLNDVIPFGDADARLRRGEWIYLAGRTDSFHDEIAGRRLGILGYGHIGRALAERARQFGMVVTVANRSPLKPSPLFDRSYLLNELEDFWRAADAFIVCVPLTAETHGIVDASAFSQMPDHALLINVARGPVVDALALYQALRQRSLRRAIIDTWYNYPTPDMPFRMPSDLPFHELDNVVMTPHMSGWTRGTIQRRQQQIAENISRVARGEPCLSVIREALPGLSGQPLRPSDPAE